VRSIEFDVEYSGPGRRCRRMREYRASQLCVNGFCGVFSVCHRDADHLGGRIESNPSRVLSTHHLHHSLPR